ncbi:MAG: class I adenylate cyclase [Gammaproteobacteria bacterium]
MSDVVFDQKTQDQHESEQQSSESPIDRFLAINAARFARVQSSLSQRKEAFLDALPMLFHLNDKALPGYISDKTAVGIANYTPTGQTMFEARRIAKNSAIGKRDPQKFDLLGMYFMGSPGTIAYNGKSDFDIWLFIDPDIDGEKLSELDQKARLIEKWAEKSSIEVHFFIINPDKFRAGETLPISTESSGSSQHGLLLDEFYRSGILIAGLPLTWWLVAPEYETHYEDYIHSQRNVQIPDLPTIDQCINLGPLLEIDPTEFFGAGIWQLNKSISSPYKSVLKLLLIELYAQDESGLSLISHQFKKRVYSGVSDIDLLDPWILMFELVEEYLENRNDELRLKVLRRSFYLKIDEKLSVQVDIDNTRNWRKKIINTLVKNWQWDEEKILELDSRDNWKLETVTSERADIVNTLTNSFRALSRFSQQVDIPKITKTDLQLLNRRLFSAFERKAGKIEIINRGISPNINEGTVSLHMLKSAPDPSWGINETSVNTRSSWVLYRGIVTEKDLGDSTHLKRTSSLIEMLSWCYFNKILNVESKISLYLPSDKNISQQEIKTILDSLTKQFPLDQSFDNQALANPAKITSGAVFVNTGLVPKQDTSLSDTLLSSQRSNALSYGGQHENLTKTFDLVFTTSWGETFIKTYSGSDSLIDCITEYMSWAPTTQKTSPAVLEVYCYSPGYGAQIRKTLNTLFKNIVDHFYDENISSDGRYILEIEDDYHCLERNGEIINHTVLSNQDELILYLEKPKMRFSYLHFGPYACDDTLLPAIYACNKKDSVQLFFHLNDNQANVYIIDEKGSLFIQKNFYMDKHSLFGHYKTFSDTIIERIMHNDLTSLLEGYEVTAELYQIEKDKFSGFEIEKLSLMSDRSNNFLSLQVLCDLDENNTEQYTIFCQEQEFSSLQYGDSLYDVVAKQIMKYRGSRLTYPAYITDIDLSQAMLNDNDKNQYQSVQFFRYKKHIELKLTRSLEKL